MVQTITEGVRTARKQWHCGMCSRPIKPGDKYAYQTNVYDGRIYTWRDCLACDRDGVINLVSAWTGGWHDEGVEYEQASEWAEEAAEWPRYWIGGRRNIHPAERLAARNWLARAAGGEGE